MFSYPTSQFTPYRYYNTIFEMFSCFHDVSPNPKNYTCIYWILSNQYCNKIFPSDKTFGRVPRTPYFRYRAYFRSIRVSELYLQRHTHQETKGFRYSKISQFWNNSAIYSSIFERFNKLILTNFIHPKCVTQFQVTEQRQNYMPYKWARSVTYGQNYIFRVWQV